MNNLVTIPRKIYYLKTTGQFILDTGESTGANIRQTTLEEDFELYTKLGDYNRNLIGCLELELGQYKEDFLRCISFRVNPETSILEFTYNEDTDESIFEKPLTEQITELEARTKATEDAILALMGGM